MKATNQKNQTRTSVQESDITRIKYETKMQSDFMRDYIGKNIGSLIMLYGRLGALLRLVDSDTRLSSMVEDWIAYNEKISYHQLDESKAQLEQIQMQSFDKLDIEMEIERPSPLVSTWKVNHSSFTNLIRLMMNLDAFLVESEEVYFKGLMSDVQMRQLSTQVQNVISTYLERILKATSPGRRMVNEQYKYSNRELGRHIKDAGYRLEFHTLPKDLEEIVGEYNDRYSRYKSLVSEREALAKKKALEKQIAKTKTVEVVEEITMTESAGDKKSPIEKTPVKKAPAKKTPTKKAPAKKAPAKKAPAKKTVKEA